MSQVTYRCRICKRPLDPEVEEKAGRDINVFPDGSAYCQHCWLMWRRWVGGYGLDVVAE